MNWPALEGAITLTLLAVWAISVPGWVGELTNYIKRKRK